MGLIPRQLGNLPLHVSPLALGTVKIGRNTGVKYPAPFDLPDDATVVNLLNTAEELGINLIDTAPAYGASEARLGRLLRGHRENWVICTKAGEYYEHQQSSFDFSAKAIRTSVTHSLKTLATDYLDIVLLHSDGRDQEIIEETAALETLVAMKQAGDIRYIGMSTKTVAGSLLALAFCDVLMVTLNTQDRSHLSVVQTAKEKGVGILVKKALASGHTDPAASLEWTAKQPGVSSVIVGTINPEHLRQNAAMIRADQQPMTD